MLRPLIGITPSLNYKMTAYRLCCAYSELVFQAGGEPLILSYDFSSPHMLGGVLFTGGGDFAPENTEYDRPELARDILPRRDALEFSLFAAARALDLPVLGICRGHQLISTATGGSLIADIPAAGFLEEHNLGEGKDYHPVICVPGSAAAAFFGEKGEIWSTHHQAVDRPGRGFTVTARSPEGVVEAIEHEDGRMLGLQTHPEQMGLLAPFEWLVRHVTV